MNGQDKMRGWSAWKSVLALKNRMINIVMMMIIMTVIIKQPHLVFCTRLFIIYISSLNLLNIPSKIEACPLILQMIRKLTLNSVWRSQGLLLREVVMVWTQICLSLKFIFFLHSARAVKGSLLAGASYGKTNTEMSIMGLLRLSLSH